VDFCTIIINNTVPKEVPKDFFTVYLPIISPVVVILTFTINTILTFYFKKQESRRAWYFKAYFESNLKKIEDFFAVVDKTMKESLLEHFQRFENSQRDDQKIVYVSSVLSAIRDLKRKFEIEVLESLQYTYPETFKDILEIMLDFEDAGSQAFTTLNANDPYFEYISTVSKIKSNLIMVLSEPAIGKSKFKSKKHKGIKSTTNFLISLDRP
jgi:molecular chaperone GrpE (heat shock protein)